MSTLEKTISMMEALPEADLLKVQNLIHKLFQQREYGMTDDAVGKILKPMSRNDFLSDVEAAEKEIDNGIYRKADEVFDGLERRYGF